MTGMGSPCQRGNWRQLSEKRYSQKEGQGNGTKVTGPHTDSDYEYDALSRLTKVIDSKLGKTITYAHNVLGSRQQMLQPEGNARLRVGRREWA